ncbi:MAG: GNAT family N-acetyltransferase [Methanobrevibacter sp.]|jgi:ribosomal protein S18 acetylase RimI-like enzyme|nr:GNAT family N-acetyltransferase [Candidatus Methanovirga aequatorialis]
MLVETRCLKEKESTEVIENLIDDNLKISVSYKTNEKLEIIDLKNNEYNVKNIQDFLFAQIKQTYGYGYIEKYHHDIKYLEKYYKYPERNNFFVVVNRKSEIIGTIGIRGYDKNYGIFNGLYSKESTASIWRVFIHENYRRLGIGTRLVKTVEKFIAEKNYNEIYLHTHKNVEGALDFWKKLDYCVTIDTEDKLKTVHMIKRI